MSAVDDRYFGLIPKNEYFKHFSIGDVITARVIELSEDGKLDLAPRMLAYQQMDQDSKLILEKMKILKVPFSLMIKVHLKRYTTISVSVRKLLKEL